MALCCVTFPPTRNFEEWLRKHLWEHTKRADAREAAFALYCVRKLDLICDAPPSLRMPSNYEIEKIRVGLRPADVPAFWADRAKPPTGSPLIQFAICWSVSSRAIRKADGKGCRCSCARDLGVPVPGYIKAERTLHSWNLSVQHQLHLF